MATITTLLNFQLSEKANSLGISRIAKEDNTIVVEINVASSDPFVTRTIDKCEELG